MKRISAGLYVPLLILALAACATGDEATATFEADASGAASAPASSTPHDMGFMPSRDASVEIESFAFDPVEITVSAGTEVTWTNLDSAPHTVTAGTDGEPMPELFDSGLLQQGESFSYVFDEPGTFVYFCDRHPPMQATVIVEG